MRATETLSGSETVALGARLGRLLAPGDFVALVVPPQVAIMSVGSIHSAPIIQDDQVVVGRRVSMTLSADHRAVDGAMAAEFLISLRDLLENPAPYIK